MPLLPWSADADAVLRPLLEGEGAPGVVAFDADGTLWRGDAGEDFLRSLAAQGALPRRPSAGLYARYEALVAHDPAAGYAFAAQAMEGMAEADLADRCTRFFRDRFAGRVFRFVRPLLQALEAQGHAVWVVSASPVWVIRAGFEALGGNPGRVIGVEVEVAAGRLTASIRRPVPCGEGKVEALRARGLRPLLAVGNGELDLPMLAFAERALVVAPPDDPGNALVRHAQRRGWPVLRA